MAVERIIPGAEERFIFGKRTALAKKRDLIQFGFTQLGKGDLVRQWIGAESKVREWRIRFRRL